MSACEIQDGLRPITFEGEQIHHVSTDKPHEPKSQWTEMTLYSVAPYEAAAEDRLGLPEGGYVCHIVGRSVAYHREDGCNAGTPVTVGQMAERRGVAPEDAMPCLRCRPADIRRGQPDPMMVISLESDRHSLYRAGTAADMSAMLEKPQPLTAPAQRLLEVAIEKDPAFAAVYGR